MDDIRSWWEVPSIAHFCSLFRSAFDLTDFDIEDLEDGFLLAQTEDGSAFLLDLLCRLLNGCYGRKDITIANYDLYVKDIIKYKWDISDSPIKEKSEFKALTMREKVELIYAICEYRLDTEDVIEQLKGFEGDSMRVEPLGKDKDGALYWYFYGNRLYMEDPEPKKELTKEEKRARDRERRIEAKKKKQEEKKRKKEEKTKLKALRKVERKKKLEEAKKIEESNTRRSGRLRTRKVEVPESESSDTSSSSEEEEETEESSQDESEKEEKVEQKSSKGRSKRTTARTSPRKETTNQKTPSTKKETPAKGTRSSSRNAAKQQKTPDPKTPQADTGTRRSARCRKKLEPPPLPSPYNSETEEDNDYDNDSGHESAGSLRSETSKVSVRSSTSKKAAAPGKRSSRRPTVNVDLKRDLSQTEDDEEGEKENDNDGCEKEKVEVDGCKGVDDDSKEEKDDETDKDGCKKDNEMEVEDSNKVNNACLADEGKGDSKEVSGEAETKKDVFVEHDGSGEGKVDKMKTDTDCDTEVVTDSSAKSDLGVPRKPKQIEPKEEQTDQTETEELEKMDETCDNKDSENKAGGDGDSKVTAATDDLDKDEHVKTDNNEVKTEEEMETDNAGGSEPSLDKKDVESENSDIKKENADVKPEVDEMSNDSNDVDVKRVLRKRTTEEIKTEPKNSDDDSKDGTEAKQDVKPCTFSLSKPAVAPQPSKSSTRWHLVCETLDDWINMAEWYMDSPVRCEKSLSKVIKEDFLPVLPEIIEARDKEKQRRFLQEQDLRRSNRITLKMREKMEQEKILAEALAEEEKARIKGEEERRLKDEQLKLEDENRQREERRKAREERAKRLSMREERARLVAEGKEIPPEMIYTAPQKYKDDGEDSDDSKCDLKEEEDYEALMKVINAMKYHKDCWPFLEPVTDEQAPGYSDVIKRPMDLSKIEEKVEKRDYRSSQHFLSDFRLMFNNCKRFNGQDSEFSDCARSMENMLKKYMKRFVSDEPTDKYYEDKPFMVPGSRGAPRTGEKRYRPQRAASSRALQTVHNALNSDNEESDSDEDDRVPVKKKPKDSTESPFKTQSHHNLLLQEMIELKRQREKKLAASALQNHGIITRGPERIRVPNPTGGVMIIPRNEMSSSGVLRMAATREIKRKVHPQQQLPNLAQNVGRMGRPPIVHTIVSQNQTVVKADLSKKDPGLSIIDQTTPGSTQPKTIRIVASNANGQPSVKQTAENVRVSSDGYLIISGKNSGIKVTENTKIVIQPPGATPPPSESGTIPEAAGKEILVKKIPTPSSFKQLPGLSLSNMTSPQSSPSATMQRPGQVPAQGVSASPGSQVPAQQQQQIDLQQLLKQTAIKQQVNQQQALQGLVNQMGNKGNLSPEMKKKLDIAQRILLLNQQKKKLLEQQKLIKQHQQEPQNGPGACPPKIIKLETSSSGLGNSSAIEERLRDPSLNIDKQLGSVSQNVISNVNIASDILDTYYSVLNDAKSTAGNQNVPSAVVTMTQNTQPLTQNISVTQNSANTGVSLSHTPVKVVAGQTTSSANIPVPQSPKPAQAQGNISEVTRQIYNLISKTGTGGLVSALAKAQLMKQNVPTSVSQGGALQIGSPGVQLPTVPSQNVTFTNTGTYQTPQVVVSGTQQFVSQAPQVVIQAPQVVIQATQVVNQAPQDLNQTLQVVKQAPQVLNQSPKVLNQAPQVVNQVPQVLNQTPQVHNQVPQVLNQVPQTVPTLTSSSSISDLLRSAMLKHNAPTSSEISPIEALLTKSCPAKTETDSVLKTVPKPQLVEALTGRTPVSLNSVSQKFESSPEKNQRQNLFDSFETSKSEGVNDLTTGQMENTDVTKEIKLKLRADGISLPASSTLNFGSPLKTSSVLEALKCKLHTVKPQTQSSEIPNWTENENVCICSELASRIPHTPGASDIMCEPHPHCTCINSSVYRLSSDSNPACTPSSSSNVESPSHVVEELPNSDVYSPNCSLESVHTVQSEKILQNRIAEETKMNNSEMYENEIDDYSVENGDILTAVPLEKYLQTVANEEANYDEVETIPEKSKNSCELARSNEHSCNDCEEQNKNRKKCQKIRIKIAIENNGQANVKDISVERSDDIKGDKEIDQVIGDLIYSDYEVARNEMIEKNFVYRSESFCNEAKGSMPSKHFNNEGKLSEYESDDNMKEAIPVDVNNNTLVTKVDVSMERKNNTVDNKQNTLDDEEKPIEFVVKKVHQSEGETGGDSTTEVLILVPKVPSPVSENNNTCQDLECHIKMIEKDSARKSVGKRSCPKVLFKENSQQPTEGTIVVSRPLLNRAYPMGVISPFLDRNYKPVGKYKKQKPRDGSQPVLSHWPLVKKAKKKIKEEEHCETNLNNVRVRRKIIRLSSEPVKMYKISGGACRKPDQGFEEKGVTTDSETVPPIGTIDNNKLDQDERKPVKKSIELNFMETPQVRSGEVYNRRDILLAACQDSKIIPNKEESLYTSESPFFKSDMDIESNMPLADIDVNKICDEDFFSTELFAPIYPSNPFYGDGSDKDPDLEKIENDIFELQDKYSTSASTFSSLLPDQITLPIVSGTTQNSAVVSGFSPTVLSAATQGGTISLNSSNQVSVPTGILGRVISLDSGNILTSVPSTVNVVQNTAQGGGIPLVFSKGDINIQSQAPTVQASTNLMQGNFQNTSLGGSIPLVFSKGDINIQTQAPTVQASTNMMQGNFQPATLPTVLSQGSGNLPTVSTMQGNIQPAMLQTVLSQGSGNLPTVSTMQGNIQPAMLQTVLSQGSGNLPTVSTMQGNIQPAMLQTVLSQGSGNLPTVSTMQGNIQPATLQTVLSQGSGNLPTVSTMQGTFQQAPIQVPSALLNALKQGTSGIAANQTTQSALLQQLNTLMSHRQPNVQMPAQNTSVVNNIQQVNLTNTIQLVNQPVNSIPAPSTLQSNIPKVHVQTIPQLSEVNFGNIASIQNDNLGQINAMTNVVSKNQGMVVNIPYSRDSAAVTNAGVIGDTVALTNHLTAVDSANAFSNFVAGNLNTVNQTSVVIDGNSTQSDLQSSFYVTGTGGELMDTSQDANILLTETEENQSQQNLS